MSSRSSAERRVAVQPATNADTRGARAPSNAVEHLWRWRWLTAAVHAALFGAVAYRALFRRYSFVGPNIFWVHAEFATHAFDEVWRPATPGYLWQVTARTLDLALGSSDPRQGAVAATVVFYALFGVAIFEVFRRGSEGRPLLGPAAALAASVVIALLESPAALGGWATYVGRHIFLPLYLPFAPTTIGSLGLNVYLLFHVADLFAGRLPARKRWRVPFLVLLATIAKPTLVPILVVASVACGFIDDRRRRVEPSAVHDTDQRSPVLPSVLRLMVAPAVAILFLQFLATTYKVQYGGFVDDRGGWAVRPLIELREMGALTPYFWLALLFPLVALVALRRSLWTDQAVRLASIATVIGIAAAVLLAREQSVWKGDVVQLPEASIAMLMVFIPRRIVELWRDGRWSALQVGVSAAALLPYLVAGTMSWTCHVGIGCPALW